MLDTATDRGREERGRAFAARMLRALWCALIIAVPPLAAAQGGDGAPAGSGTAAWRPAPTPLSTRWAADVSPTSAHPEYPRPQLVRDAWLNLNGLWQLAITPAAATAPGSFDRTILVPFPVESSLSGVGERVDGRALWYRRSFEIPGGWAGARVLLHFGAVDYDASVTLNGRELGRHRGGYDAFTLDVTDALWPFGPQELVVRVTDPSDGGTQPRGKQVRDPNGIWYTPSSGIWQTVWLEPVPDTYIERLELVPDQRGVRLTAVAAGAGMAAGRVVTGSAAGGGGSSAAASADAVEAVLLADGREVTRVRGRAGEPLTLRPAEPRPWSPDAPFLYDLRVTLITQDGAGGAVRDAVLSYVGLRTVSLGTGGVDGGPVRILLNGRALFQYGVLDQGFWPDGLYTAPTDEAIRNDLATAKRLGFNMVRKHVKVEPATYYAWADRLGVLVWQDMPSGDDLAAQGAGEIRRGAASAEQFERELERMVEGLGNHPSIVTWVLFNEGWGQYDTARLTARLRELDPTRLIDAASGWNDLGAGDLADIHRYPGPDAPALEPDRAAVLGEFGGLGLPVAGLTWLEQGSWGYRAFDDPLVWSDAYAALLERVRALEVDHGLAAAVYTQLTDVESEVNGLMTYDRSLIKAEPTRLRSAARKLSWPLPVRRVLVPTSEAQGVPWRYLTEGPPEGWAGPAFDDASWAVGPGGFGRPDSPGAVVRTPWDTRELWLRRAFDYTPDPSGAPAQLVLRVHHDEDVQVYLNGTPVIALPYSTQHYVDVPLGPEAAGELRQGENVLALHCHQLGYGQYCDAGLTALEPGAAP